MLHKNIFGFHKSDFVKCKLLTNLEEKFIAGKNRMNNQKNISEAAVRRCSQKFCNTDRTTCVRISFLIKLRAL